MTSSFPFPAQVGPDSRRTDSAPTTDAFGAANREPAMLPGDREGAPDFADLCDQASAPATPPAAEQTGAAVDAESPPTATSEPAAEPAVAESSPPSPAAEHEDATIVATAVAAPASEPPPALATTPQVSPLAGHMVPSGAAESPASSATLAEYTSCLALRSHRRVDPASKHATATTPTLVPGPLPTATATATPAHVLNQPSVAAPAAATVPAKSAGGSTASPAAASPAATPVSATATPTSVESTTTSAAVDAPAIAAAASFVARSPTVRPVPEKVSGRAVLEETPGATTGQKNSVDTGQQLVAHTPGSLGTGAALHDDTMKSGPQFAPRSLPLASDAGVRAAGHGGGADPEFSFAWKGWTNGGGERASTAAQFSRLTEHALATVASHANPASTAGRAAAAALANPPAPAYPTNEAALLAPIGAAIERLVTRGQEQLSVVVRFEQGGSLSLQLTMRDGGIAAHMQTDVPGLEAALRSSWSSFAQDWNQRGVKLAAPSFGTGVNPDLADGRDQQRPAQHEAHSFSGETSMFGALPGRRPFRSAARGDVESSSLTAATKFSRARLAQRGLSTWA